MSIPSIRQEIDSSRKSGVLKTILIPPCPELLARLQQAMAQEQPDLNEVARIAASDVAMSAILLRMANSPVHIADGMPCTTVGQAMTRIGLKETTAIMTGFLLKNAIPVNSPHLARFWERSAKRALAMSFVARQLPGISVDLAHTYGLFCHVGMPVLLQCVRGYGSTMVEAAARVDRSYIATENANHRTDHAVAGALLARAWNMAPELMAAIRLHHDLFSLGDSRVEPEVHTLIAAGLIAEHLMRLHEGLPEDADWIAHAPQALDWLNASLADVEHWDDLLRPILDEA
ncbi:MULTISPECIES: HDOD domain-containing protein [Roseateles]|uniref:HDOD domain-containing protein n=1 Tax=Roseateles albus TaxID=2987525 RepID=A0ABT5KB84_9BURK|nr:MULTISPECIES: HDOD domain-containing protein [Roseateles]MCV2358932.1 HDOD domain-containing protein [Paucibacter sp. TC2R-5]MDC8771200.1 HDOD domain-containing protein [Roseateles albus]